MVQLLLFFQFFIIVQVVRREILLNMLLIIKIIIEKGINQKLNSTNYSFLMLNGSVTYNEKCDNAINIVEF